MKSVILMVLKWLFLPKNHKKTPNGCPGIPDFHILHQLPQIHFCDKIQLHQFAQHAVQVQHFSKKIQFWI